MELNLYLKEGEQLKVLKVPPYVVKDLIRDRLSESEIGRIHRFAEETKKPDVFAPGSVVVDFSHKTAQCFQSGLNILLLDPTWNVKVEKVTLVNY